mmetsp:Transcript_44019/g.141471  ORF Transcript_44019/g.141471 Transcript_44019/m.141471 type:complete len:247 (+) Transcript_44019:429-1169(+)
MPTSITHVSRTTLCWKTGSAASWRGRPTNMHSSPTSSGVGERVADLTLSPQSSAGSYLTRAMLWVGWRKAVTAGTSTVEANSIRHAPSATGTVLRSTSTRPTAASTTTPIPAYLRPATPSIWYGMSKSTRTRDGVTARTSGGPATAKATRCGTGGGGGGGGGSVEQVQREESASRSYRSPANHVRSTSRTASRSVWCEYGRRYRTGTRAPCGSERKTEVKASKSGVLQLLSSEMTARLGTFAFESM